MTGFEPSLFRPSHQFYGHEGLKNRFSIKAICFFCVLKHNISKISLFLAINGCNMYPPLYTYSAWPAKVVSPIWAPLASFFDMRSSIQSSIEISVETLDYTIRIGSTPTILYFDFYLYSAYAAHAMYIYIYLYLYNYICGIYSDFVMAFWKYLSSFVEEVFLLGFYYA